MLSESEGAQATEGESKHPEGVSPAMWLQGVLFEDPRADDEGPCVTGASTRSGFTSWEAAPERLHGNDKLLR